MRDTSENNPFCAIQLCLILQRTIPPIQLPLRDTTFPGRYTKCDTNFVWKVAPSGAFGECQESSGGPGPESKLGPIVFKNSLNWLMW